MTLITDEDAFEERRQKVVYQCHVVGPLLHVLPDKVGQVHLWDVHVGVGGANDKLLLFGGDDRDARLLHHCARPKCPQAERRGRRPASLLLSLLMVTMLEAAQGPGYPEALTQSQPEGHL